MNIFDVNLLFESTIEEQTDIDEFNKLLYSLDERKRQMCTIRPTDSANKKRKKCKVAKIWGIHYAPVYDRYVTNDTPTTTDTSAAPSPAPAMEATEDSTSTLEYTRPSEYPNSLGIGEERWNELLDKGKLVPWGFLDDVEKYQEDLDELDPEVVEFEKTCILTGKIEVPVIGRDSAGNTQVLTGGTRLAVLNSLGFEPLVLVVPMPTKRKRTQPKPTPRKKPTTKKVQKRSKTKAPSKPQSKPEKPKSSTERVRRYYKRHPEKVRKYLKKTQDDRVKRNGDRAKAVEKYGKKKMKNHDVHHPNGVNGGKWQLARKDHGRDKKNENLEYVYLSELKEGMVPNTAWQLISEGGAAGHLAHPYEDNSLSFKDVKEMIKRGLVGGLDAEDAVTEKLDGQNIMFTVKDGRVLFARNKSQVKNNGKNALDTAGIKQMFAGRGNVEKAFTSAAEDLQNAVNSLPPERQQDMFKDGGKFMNVEIVFPDTRNVIPYDKSVLVFHGTVDYDLEGNEVGRNIQDGKALSDELTKVNAQQQATFGLSGPRSISFSDADTANNLKKMKEYGRTVSRIQQEFKLDDKATIEDYKVAWWAREVDNMGIDWSDDERKGLIRRWALGDKKFGVKNIESPEKKKLFREYEANQLAKAQKTAVRPLERVFLRLGADTLLRVTNFLSANNPELTAGLKKEVLDVIKQVQETGDVDKIAKLQTQIERLEDIGINNIVPSEGIVFMYNGNPYKFTGTFAPVNQILGTLRFAKGKAEEIGQEQPTEPETTQPETPAGTEPTQSEPTEEPQPEEPQEQKTIAIFPGRFQPFHAGHYSIYRALVTKFGEENVYIGSSNKVDPITSPFSFNDKKEIMTKMFGIPEEQIVQVKNPYKPVEILQKYPENTVFTTAVSQKDSERLGGNYYKSYEDTPPEERKGYLENGYVIIAPEMQLQIDGKNISGTQIRSIMGDSNITDRAKQEIFTKIYGKFDKKLFNKIVKTTTQSEEAKALTTAHGGKETRAKVRMKKQPEIPQPAAAAVQQPQVQPVLPAAQQEPQQQAPAQQDPTKQRQSAEPEDTAPQDVYEPGETWQTTGGLFGAKSMSTQETRYFKTQQSAQIYSQS